MKWAMKAYEYLERHKYIEVLEITPELISFKTEDALGKIIINDDFDSLSIVLDGASYRDVYPSKDDYQMEYKDKRVHDLVYWGMVCAIDELVIELKKNRKDEKEFKRRAKEIYNLLHMVSLAEQDTYYDILDYLEVPSYFFGMKESSNWIATNNYDAFQYLYTVFE